MRSGVRGDWKPGRCATLRSGSRTTAGSGRRSSGDWMPFCMICKLATPRLRTAGSGKKRVPVKGDQKDEKQRNVQDYGAWGPRDCSSACCGCTTPARILCVHQAGTNQEVVARAGRLVDADLRDRLAGGGQVSLC